MLLPNHDLDSIDFTLSFEVWDEPESKCAVSVIETDEHHYLTSFNLFLVEFEMKSLPF